MKSFEHGGKDSPFSVKRPSSRSFTCRDGLRVREPTAPLSRLAGTALNNYHIAMSNYPTSAQIRRQFIDYFVEKCGHTFVPSSPCVPLDDPTLMFTNAGMNQFKPIFLGQRAPDVDTWSGATPGMPTRAANTQKCIRAGGKHNDLDDVGHDTYHHTFFEMLGNWSFGDYFKKEAIEWAWDLLTRVWGVDPQRLHATYFQGDAAEGLEPDTEARDLWQKILPPERVHPGNKKDNFWEMGDSGPCGPCSEIHIDLTPDRSGGHLVNAGDARVMEIWNLVFIQFNRGGDGKLTPLPAKHVDTGMGFERITSVLQGKRSNYDTDVFTPIFAAIQRVTGAATYTGLLEGDSPDHAAVMKDIAYRVVGDHLRTLTFAITDGATPSNEGRGYVLRRILRRAVRYGRQYLGTHEPFMCKLVPSVVEAMGAAFPELKKNPGRVADVIRDEEQSFIKTLDRGITLFNEAADYARTHHHGRIAGDDAFKLHDTYGFPIDLTELMAEEQGLTVDIGEYERRMEEARALARGSTKTGAFSFGDLPADIASKLQPTDDSAKYVTSSMEAEATHVLRVEPDQSITLVKNPEGLYAGVFGAVVLNRTCFYGEQGGQAGDQGVITAGSEEEDWFLVQNTIRVGNTVLHVGEMKRGAFGIGEPVTIRVGKQRVPTMKNHTATHVLNWALRDVLGDHVQQKGSLVDPDKTRFDFSHPSQLTEEQINRIEEMVNAQIEEDLEVFTAEVEQKKALEINTLRAVFGEKYPERVRVVSVGVEVPQLIEDPKNDEWMKYSVEFCGGTHVKRTSEIERFRLIEESAVAKGIRRVTGITGEKAAAAEAAAESLEAQIDKALRLDDSALPHAVSELTTALNAAEIPVLDKSRLRGRLAELQERAKKAVKQQAKAGAADIMGRADAVLAEATKVSGVSIICADMGSAGIDQLRAACDSLRARAGSAAILLAAENEGKVVLLAAMTSDVVNRGLKAGDLIKEIAPIVGGKGGGKPDLAQGGGSDSSSVDKAVEAARDWIQTRIH
jgi:alanyl-tRNA synthetase